MKTSTIVAALLIACLATACGLNTPAEGEKIGTIVRVQRSGVLTKTWEGQLIRGGMNNGSGVMGIAPFHFTIEDPKLLTAVQAAMEHQTEVLVTYRDEGIYSFSRSDSGGTFLLSIRPYLQPPDTAK